MRVVKVQGGLGNQLFCLGFAHTLATRTGERVAVDVAAYDTDRYGRTFLLGPLATRLDKPVVRRPWRSSRIASALMAAVPGGYFTGYWQDERYLSPGFRDLARAWLLEMAGHAPSPGVVIHYRTYQEEIRPHRRATPDAAWFARCFERLDARGVDTTGARLISDNPALALSRLGESAQGVEPILGGTPWTDMAALLNARALILTNSSFSWWGGYCGVAETILYPARTGLFHYPEPAARFAVVA